MKIIKKISKSKNKKMIALLTCTALLTNIFSSTASALVMNSNPLIKDTYFKDKNKGFIYYTSEINDENGDVVYCINSRKDFPENIDYTKGNIADDATLRILENGYPNASITGDNKIDRIITQTAIWAHLDKEYVSADSLIGVNKVDYVETENPDLTKAFNDFYNKCVSGTTNRDVTATFKNTNLTFKQDGDVYKSNAIELNIAGSNIRTNKNAKLILPTADIEVDELLIIDANGNKITNGELPINKPFTIEISKETRNKIVNLKDFKIGAEVSFETKNATIWNSQDTLIQNVVKIDWNEKTIQVDNKLNLINDLKGKIKIIKQDSITQELLDGAVFNIKDKNSNIIETTEPTVNGVITTNELDFGEYVIEEVTAPNNYILSKDNVSVNVNKEDIIEVIIKNEKISTPVVNTGSVEVTKIDKDDKTVLENAVFELYKEGNTTPQGEFVTDKNGIITIVNLEVGNYYLKEIKAPNGYILGDNNIYNFEIKNNEVTKIVVENVSTQGELFFTKTDLVSGNVIEGAKIEVTGIDENNKDVKVEFISSKDGNRIKLPIGKYQIKEIIAPNGYVLSEEVGTFEIKDIGEVVKAELKNRPMLFNVEILKLDAKNKNKVLEGAEFTIYNKDGKELGKGTTDKNGKLKFENLLFDEYVIKETKAPTGYKLSKDSLSIKSPEKDGETISIEVLNTPIKLVQTGGEASNILIIGAGLALVVGGVIFIVKSNNGKTKKTNKTNKK